MATLARELLGEVLRAERMRQGRTLREVSVAARVSLATCPKWAGTEGGLQRVVVRHQPGPWGVAVKGVRRGVGTFRRGGGQERPNGRLSPSASEELIRPPTAGLLVSLRC